MANTQSEANTMEVDGGFIRKEVNPRDVFTFQMALQEKMKENMESFASEEASTEEEVCELPASPPISPRNSQSGQLKSALKPVSSYGNMERIGEKIPIVNKKTSWKALPQVSKTTMKRSQSSASFLALSHTQENSTEKSTTTNSMHRVKSMSAFQSCSDKPRVGFGKVHVREHPMIVGDNPSCRSTLPISLDWEYQEYEPLCINAYEDSRGMRRSRTEMQLSYAAKLNILKHVPAAEIKAAQRATRRVQQQRALTSRRPARLHKFDDMIEKAGRKAKRILMGKSRSEGSLLMCGV